MIKMLHTHYHSRHEYGALASVTFSRQVMPLIYMCTPYPQLRCLMSWLPHPLSARDMSHVKLGLCHAARNVSRVT